MITTLLKNLLFMTYTCILLSDWLKAASLSVCCEIYNDFLWSKHKNNFNIASNISRWILHRVWLSRCFSLTSTQHTSLGIFTTRTHYLPHSHTHTGDYEIILLMKLAWMVWAPTHTHTRLGAVSRSSERSTASRLSAQAQADRGLHVRLGGETVRALISFYSIVTAQTLRHSDKAEWPFLTSWRMT